MENLFMYNGLNEFRVNPNLRQAQVVEGYLMHKNDKNEYQYIVCHKVNVLEINDGKITFGVQDEPDIKFTLDARSRHHSYELSDYVFKQEEDGHELSEREITYHPLFVQKYIYQINKDIESGDMLRIFFDVGTMSYYYDILVVDIKHEDRHNNMRIDGVFIEGRTTPKAVVLSIEAFADADTCSLRYNGIEPVSFSILKDFIKFKKYLLKDDNDRQLET